MAQAMAFSCNRSALGHRNRVGSKTFKAWRNFIAGLHHPAAQPVEIVFQGQYSASGKIRRQIEREITTPRESAGVILVQYRCAVGQFCGPLRAVPIFPDHASRGKEWQWLIRLCASLWHRVALFYPFIPVRTTSWQILFIQRSHKGELRRLWGRSEEKFPRRRGQKFQPYIEGAALFCAFAKGQVKAFFLVIRRRVIAHPRPIAGQHLVHSDRHHLQRHDGLKTIRSLLPGFRAATVSLLAAKRC